MTLLVLFTMYLAGITAFTHFHYVNGVQVVHSHPFQETHTHSDAAFLIIGHSPTLCENDDEGCELLHPWRMLLAILSARPVSSTPQGDASPAFSLRAPPFRG